MDLHPYVIVRGSGFVAPPGTFVRTFSSGRWELWERAPPQVNN